MARPFGKITICTICKTAPRDMTLKDAHCRSCNRKQSRDDRRLQRGTPPEKFRATLEDQANRPHPLGTCYDCGGAVYRNGRCREHGLAYQRAFHQRRRDEAKALRPPKPVKVKSEPKPKAPIVRRTPIVGKAQPRVPIPDVPIVIGPKAFERPKPVDIRGHKVTRLAPVGEWGR
jgi:hypothetical protein